MTLRKKADKLWRTKGKENARCELHTYLGMVHDYSQLHPHHVVGRKNKRLCWDLRNRCWLCPSHHTLSNYSAHNDPDWFHKQFKQFRPDDWKYIQKVKKEITHYKDHDIKEIIDKLKDIN